MVEDPLKRLEDYGQIPVPAADRAFADRLESKLRATHGEIHHHDRRRSAVWLPRLGVAVVVVVASILGAVVLTGRDAGVPVLVIEGDTAPPADFAAAPSSDDSDEPLSPVADPSATPTVEKPADDALETPAPDPTTADLTAAGPTATPAAAPASPAAVPSVTNSSPTPEPTASRVVPTAPEGPSPTPVLTPVPTAPVPTAPAPTSVVAAATSQPVPTPSPTTRPQATVEPTPTTEREPAAIALRCVMRSSGEDVGVMCTWDLPLTDRVLETFEVWRSRNGEDAVVIAQRHPTELSYLDRDVTIGDEVIYLLRGLDSAEHIVATSLRQRVEVIRRR